ncbi:MAG: SDR family NAD(P)-dependent oxidoreductase [Sphingorhabdus sp.]
MTNRTLPFQNQVAVITGAASGLGFEIASLFVDSGADVILNYRSDKGELDTLVARAKAQGQRAMLVQGDVSTDGDCKALAEAAAIWGQVDVLVNNAGVTKHVQHSNLDGLDAADFERIFAVNLIAPYQLTRAMKPLLEAAYTIAETPRSVVMVSSVAGLLANGSSIAYSASKAALNNMTLALARVLAPAARVNAICPGYIDTPWFTKGAGEERANAVRVGVAEIVPLQRAAQPKEIAASIVAMSSDDFMHMTGTTLLVDDGLSLLGPA